MSSCESALFLRDLYVREYTKATRLKNGYSEYSEDVETVFACTLKRESESVEDFTSYKRIIDEYVFYDIKKFFGLTIKEFLELTVLAKEALTSKAEKLAATESAELARINSTMDGNLKP